MRKGKRVKLSSWNVCGIQEQAKRDMVEICMKRNEVGVTVIQETRVMQNCRERRKENKTATSTNAPTQHTNTHKPPTRQTARTARHNKTEERRRPRRNAHAPRRPPERPVIGESPSTVDMC